MPQLTLRPLVALALVGCFISSSEAPTDGGADATGEPTIDASDAGEPTCPPPPDAGDLPCDVSAVFQTHCQKCHTSPKPAPPDNGPFPLRTYENLTAPFGTTSLLIWQRVAQVIEPNNFPHMPPPTEPQLTPSDFDTLHAWFDACAPAVAEGSGCDIGEGADAAAD